MSQSAPAVMRTQIGFSLRESGALQYEGRFLGWMGAGGAGLTGRGALGTVREVVTLPYVDPVEVPVRDQVATKGELST